QRADAAPAVGGRRRRLGRGLSLLLAVGAGIVGRVHQRDHPRRHRRHLPRARRARLIGPCRPPFPPPPPPPPPDHAPLRRPPPPAGKGRAWPASPAAPSFSFPSLFWLAGGGAG